MLKKTVPFFLSCIIFMAFSRCGKTFWEKGKEGAIRTLVDLPLETGEYIVFWDGKDEQKQVMSAGTYICRFLTTEYDRDIEMQGLDGGKGVSADSSGYVLSFPMHFSIEQNHPNPFYMKNGTNIPFSIPHSTHVQLTIHKKE